MGHELTIVGLQREVVHRLRQHQFDVGIRGNFVGREIEEIGLGPYLRGPHLDSGLRHHRNRSRFDLRILTVLARSVSGDNRRSTVAKRGRRLAGFAEEQDDDQQDHRR